MFILCQNYGNHFEILSMIQLTNIFDYGNICYIIQTYINYTVIFNIAEEINQAFGVIHGLICECFYTFFFFFLHSKKIANLANNPTKYLSLFMQNK